MSQFLFRLFCICSVADLTACATYSPILTQETASVRFVVKQKSTFGHDPNFTVAALSDEQCNTAPPAGRIADFSTSAIIKNKHAALGMIGGDDVEIRDKHEVQIPANERFSFVFRETDPFWTCTVALSFAPVSGNQYEVEFRRQRAACHVEISRLEVTPEHKIIRSPDTTVHLLSCDWPLSQSF